MDKITEINCETNEVLVRELTADEIAQSKIDADNDKAYSAAITQAATDKAAATAKLAALGLTTDDLKALGLGTN